MQEGDPFFATHEVQDNWPCSRLLMRETPVEVPYKCTCVAFLAQSAHHLLGNLTLHIFSGVFLKPIRLVAGSRGSHSPPKFVPLRE